MAAPASGLAVALDGKVLRGSCDHDLGTDGKLLDKPAQQVSGLDLATGTVVVQLGSTGRKEEVEEAALRKVLDHLAPGTCVIADALHTQRETARQILDRGLDFLLVVKENQPTVPEQVRDGFQWDCLRFHQTTDCDHGRIETRWIRVSDELDPTVSYVDFPGVRFAAQVHRDANANKTGRERKPETVYLLTSLGPEQATHERLLALNRGYWGIENRIHYVRDVAPGEDKSRCRKDSLPRVLAAFANLAISILRLAGVPNIQDQVDLLYGDCLGTMTQLACGTG